LLRSGSLKASQTGVLDNTATVQAPCGTASTKATTTIKGIAAILLEVIDVDDPVEVGGTTSYVITVTNQGSAVDTNVVVTCTLPAEETYVSSTGPTEAAVKGQVVSFAPLGVLAPKARAVYKVNVKGASAGDVRFKVSLKSDQMTSPAEETEPTRIYE